MKPTRGRRSIFRPKDKKNRVVGILTDKGMAAFELKRHTLASIADRDPDDVSDADTIEHMARGEAETRRVINQK
jgi:hypothetical protein